MSVKSFFLGLIPILFLVASVEAVVVSSSPVAVPYYSGVMGDPVANVIDGSLTTHCVLQTDTFDGTNPSTIPAYAAGTTGHMIFDMGEVLDLTGITLYARNHAAQLTPKNVDFFYFADGIAYDSDNIEGDPNLVLIDNYTFAGPTLTAGETFDWGTEIHSQYIGMRVNSGYAEGPTYYNYQIAEVRLNANKEYEDGPASPVAAPLVSGTLSGHPIGNVIDGNLSTIIVVLDDTLDGSSTSTDPDYAMAPVTGHIVFDMGESVSLAGAIMTSRNHSSSLGPKDVDFFYYADDDPFNNAIADDIEGDDDIISITDHLFSGINLGGTEEVDWDAITARYIGMRVNSSYSEGPTYYNFQMADMQFIVQTQAVPEPSTFALMAIGAGILLGVRFRRKVS